MALNITRRDIEEASSYARDAMRFAKSNSSTGESVVGSVVQSLEVGIGAMGVGVLTGRFGPLHIGGNPIPLDLAAALALHLLGFMGLAGKHETHLHNFADGAMAGYLTKFGVGLGAKMRADAGKPALNLTDISGDNDGRRGPPPQMTRGNSHAKRPMSISELAAMAQGVR